MVISKITKILEMQITFKSQREDMAKIYKAQIQAAATETSVQLIPQIKIVSISQTITMNNYLMETLIM